MDMDCQDDFSDDELYSDDEALKPVTPLVCLEYFDPGQVDDFSPSGTPPWRRLAPLSQSQDSFFGTDIVDTIPHSPPGAPSGRRVRDFSALHETSHAESHPLSEASYVPPHHRVGLSNAAALTSLLNMVGDEVRTPAHLQPFNLPIDIPRFDAADVFHDASIGVDGNLEYGASDMDASASEEEDQDIESSSDPQEIACIPYSTPPPIMPSPKPCDAVVQPRSPSPPGVKQAEPSPLITYQTIVHEDAPDSGKDVLLVGLRTHTPLRHQSPRSPRPSASPASPRYTPTLQLSAINVAPATADLTLPPPAASAVNTRKRSREEEGEVDAETEAFTSLAFRVVDVETAAPTLFPRPITVGAPSSMEADGYRSAARDDLPPPAKRARLSTAAGFVAGAVAGSALTWVGLAYL
jgi:hypothetical protein